jgi:cytochrome c553
VLVITGAGVILGGEVKVHTIPQMVLYALAFVCVVGLGYFGAKMVYGGWSGEGATTDAPEGQEAAFASGSEAFAANCQACHPRGGNVVDPSLPLKGSQRLASLEAFTAFIRSPSKPDGSAGSMPPFGEADRSRRRRTCISTSATRPGRRGQGPAGSAAAPPGVGPRPAPGIGPALTGPAGPPAAASGWRSSRAPGSPWRPVLPTRRAGSSPWGS